MTKPNELATYEERSRKLDRKAKAALLKSVGNDWAIARKNSTEIEKLTIQTANRLRLIGVKLQESAGHEQIGFEWYQANRDSLPKDMVFKALKVCVHLARSSEKEFERYDEVKKAQQLFFEALGESTAPHRTTPQQLHDDNPWSEFVSGVSSLTSLFNRLDDRPMVEWPREKLEQFVQTTKPVVEKHEAAVRLIGGAK